MMRVDLGEPKFYRAAVNLPQLVAKLTSPRKVLACVGGGLTLLGFARIVVLVVESYSAVWSERAADRELIRMCESGAASLSADFRALCLKKRAEQSAPLLLKALLRACASAFADFCESMSSPTKVVLLLLFCLTGVAAPVVKALATLLVDNLKRRSKRRAKAHESDSESDDEQSHRRVVLVSSTLGAGGACNPWTTRLRRSLRSAQRIGLTDSAHAGPLALGSLDDEDERPRW